MNTWHIVLIVVAVIVGVIVLVADKYLPPDPLDFDPFE